MSFELKIAKSHSDELIILFEVKSKKSTINFVLLFLIYLKTFDRSENIKIKIINKQMCIHISYNHVYLYKCAY